MIAATIDNSKYISFNDDGEILRVGRSPLQDYPWIKVEAEKLKDIQSGKASLHEYTVEYDFLEKQFFLKHDQEIKQDKVLRNFLHQIQSENNAELTIIQDKTQYCWRIHVDEKFKDQMAEQNIKIDPTLNFYSVTKKDDPHTLYRMLQFDNSLEIPFEYDFEIDNTEVSIYTVRKFSSYKHEVIDG